MQICQKKWKWRYVKAPEHIHGYLPIVYYQNKEFESRMRKSTTKADREKKGKVEKRLMSLAQALQIDQLIISPLITQELLMIPTFHDSALIKNVDYVCFLNGT